MREKLAPYLVAGAIALGGGGLLAVAESINDQGNQDCTRVQVGIDSSGNPITQCARFTPYPEYNTAQIIGGAGVATEIADLLLLVRLVAFDIRKIKRRPLSE